MFTHFCVYLILSTVPLLSVAVLGWFNVAYWSYGHTYLSGTNTTLYFANTPLGDYQCETNKFHECEREATLSSGICVFTRTMFPTGYGMDIVALLLFMAYLLSDSSEFMRRMPQCYHRYHKNITLPRLFVFALFGLTAMFVSMLAWQIYCSDQWIGALMHYRNALWAPQFSLYHYWWEVFLLLVCSMIFIVVAFCIMKFTKKSQPCQPNTPNIRMALFEVDEDEI